MPGLVLRTKAGRLGQDFTHNLLLGRRFEFDVDKAWASDVDRLDPGLVSRRGKQGSTQVFGQLAWVELERLGQLHGCRGRQIAMGGDFGRLESRFGTRTGG